MASTSEPRLGKEAAEPEAEADENEPSAAFRFPIKTSRGQVLNSWREVGLALDSATSAGDEAELAEVKKLTSRAFGSDRPVDSWEQAYQPKVKVNVKDVKDEEDEEERVRVRDTYFPVRTFRRQHRTRKTLHNLIGGSTQKPVSKPAAGKPYRGTEELPIERLCCVGGYNHTSHPGAQRQIVPGGEGNPTHATYKYVRPELAKATWLYGSGPTGGVVHLNPHHFCDADDRPVVFPLFVGHDAEW